MEKVFCRGCKHLVTYEAHYPDCIRLYDEMSGEDSLPTADKHLGKDIIVRHYYKKPAMLKNIDYDCEDWEKIK